MVGTKHASSQNLFIVPTVGPNVKGSEIARMLSAPPVCPTQFISAMGVISARLLFKHIPVPVRQKQA